MKSKKAIVSLSGGMDSTTVLAWFIHNGYTAEAVMFSYGSKHNQYENQAAKDVAAHYNIPIIAQIDLSNVSAHLKSNLLKSGGDIPEGHYTDETMSATVVPGRNIIFASILAGIAQTRGASMVGLGIHQGDHAIYPDCRREFFTHMTRAIHHGTDRDVFLMAPFLNKDKIGILKWGMKYKVPYELTRTCYKDQPVACGKCGSCVERLEAFTINGIIDPVEYE